MRKNSLVKELEELLKRVKEESGIELYHHAYGREDLNDVEGYDGSHYVRAAENIRDEVFKSRKLGPSVDCLYAVNTRNLGGVFKPLEDFEVIAHGLLRQFNSLSEIVQTENSSKPYFAGIYLNSSAVRDAGYRQGGPACFTIVGNKDFISGIVTYLQRNPNKLHYFARNLLPKEKFPNVNKNLIPYIRPTGVIYFVDTSSGWIGSGPNEYGGYCGIEEWMLSKKGTKVVYEVG